MNLVNKYANPGRSQYWDNLKGILIILVVLGHFLWEYWGLGYSDFILKFIYLFHMPAFAYVSGFLSKSENSRSKEKIIRLLLMYLIFNSTIMILHNFLFEPYFTFISPYYSYWFLISLIIWRLTIKYLANIKGILLMLTAAAFLIGFWSDVTNVFAISRTIVFYPFFFIGYSQNLEKITAQLNTRKISDYLKGMLLIIIAAGISFFIIENTDLLSQTNMVMDTYTSVMDFIARFAFFDVSLFMIGGITILTSNRQIPLLSRLGRNSLAIYVLHRPITFIFVLMFPKENYSELFVLYALIATAITVSLLGLDVVSGKLNSFFDKIAYFLTSGLGDITPKRKRLWNIIVSLSIVLFLAQPIIITLVNSKNGDQDGSNSSEFPIHRTLTSEQKEAIENSVSLAFVGDLILLQGQVENAYDEVSMKYNFDPMFEYAKKYLDEADYAIGIFEGPTAGAEAGYSTSNYDDGIPMALNFPDSFAKAVKDSGIDFVSTANNLLLDKGIEGAYRTQRILEEAGLSYTAHMEPQKKRILSK
jgi:fucose 4-O-acetylase-like acetyltransferase